jgi:hypothetical protein
MFVIGCCVPRRTFGLADAQVSPQLHGDRRKMRAFSDRGRMPLSAPPPRGGRFGSPLVLSRVHWVRPEMVVEVSYA